MVVGCTTFAELRIDHQESGITRLHFSEGLTVHIMGYNGILRDFLGFFSYSPNNLIKFII
jgi:hypothetical protein